MMWWWRRAASPAKHDAHTYRRVDRGLVVPADVAADLRAAIPDLMAEVCDELRSLVAGDVHLYSPLALIDPLRRLGLLRATLDAIGWIPFPGPVVITGPSSRGVLRAALRVAQVNAIGALTEAEDGQQRQHATGRLIALQRFARQLTRSDPSLAIRDQRQHP